jgi:hypothetical protein
MSLLDLQSILARLYTDSGFRAAFFRDPSQAGSAAGLTAAELRLLAALDRGQVERFARSLQQKRLGLARELLPAAAGLLGNGFACCFFEYCDRHPSARERTDEAIAFLDDLMGTLPHRAAEEPLPGYWRDLLLCERLHLEVRAAASRVDDSPLPTSPAPPSSVEAPLDARPQRVECLRLEAFEYDVATLYPQTSRGELREALPDPCFLLLAPAPAGTRVRITRINAPTARLLTLCDGTRPLASILDDMAADLQLSPADGPAFAAECRRLLVPLGEQGLIRWL